MEYIELAHPDYNGLNLSIEVLEGLMKHQSSWDNPKANIQLNPSIEAQIVNLGDEIAYQNHDVDDGIRSCILSEKDLSQIELWSIAKKYVYDNYGDIKNDKIRVKRIISKMMSLMIQDVENEAKHRIQKNGISSLKDVYNFNAPLVDFSANMKSKNKELKYFLMEKLYYHPDVVMHSDNGKQIITKLFNHYVENLDSVPREVLESKGSLELLKDYLAGMTDRFAEKQVFELGL